MYVQSDTLFEESYKGSSAVVIFYLLDFGYSILSLCLVNFSNRFIKLAESNKKGLIKLVFVNLEHQTSVERPQFEFELLLEIFKSYGL